MLDALRLPWRFLRGGRGRLGLTVAALACGVALACAIDLVNRSVMRAFTEVVDTMAGRASLQVSTGGDGFFPESTAAAVAAVPGVELAVPVVTAVAFTADGSGELLTVHGIDVASEPAVRVYAAHDDGSLDLGDALEFLNQADSILLTHAFAARRGLVAGDRIQLETAQGRRTFTVRGLLAPQGVARVYGGNLAVMDLFAAEAAFTRPGLVNRVDVVVRSDADLGRVRAAVAEALPAAFRVDMPVQRKADLQKAMQSLQLLLTAVGLVALVAAFLIAFNRLSCVYEARTWQMGILRAVGLRSTTVWWQLLKESLLLGAAGAAVGVPLGLALAKVLLPAIAATTALNYKLVAPEAELHLAPASVLVAVALGLVAAASSALMPAWRAAGVSVIESVHGRGVEVRDTRPGLLLATRGAAAAALALALAMQAATHAAAWGMATTVLVVVATGLVARPLLERAFASPLARLADAFGPTGRFAAAFVRLNPRRTARTASMLGVGLGSVVWLGMIAHSFEASLLDALSQGMRADVVVSSAHIGAGYLEAPIDDALIGRLRAIPGIERVAGVRVRDWPLDGGDVALDAADPEYYADSRLGRWPLVEGAEDEAWAAVGRGEAVVVSSNLAMNAGVGIGDVLRFETPGGPLSLPIVGINTDFASPRGTVKISRAVYKRYWNDPQATRFYLAAAPGTDLEALRARIAHDLGAAYGLRILSSSELHEYFRTQVRRAFAPLDMLAGMVLLVVLFGMSDTLAAGVLERTRDIGIMRAIGAQRHHLRRLELAEAFIPGGLGLLLALACGLALGALWVQSTFPAMLGWVLATRVPWLRIELVVVATLAVCAAGSILPGIQAARLDPGEAIRSE